MRDSGGTAVVSVQRRGNDARVCYSANYLPRLSIGTKVYDSAGQIGIRSYMPPLKVDM